MHTTAEDYAGEALRLFNAGEDISVELAKHVRDQIRPQVNELRQRLTNRDAAHAAIAGAGKLPRTLSGALRYAVIAGIDLLDSPVQNGYVLFPSRRYPDSVCYWRQRNIAELGLAGMAMIRLAGGSESLLRIAMNCSCSGVTKDAAEARDIILGKKAMRLRAVSLAAVGDVDGAYLSLEMVSKMGVANSDLKVPYDDLSGFHGIIKVIENLIARLPAFELQDRQFAFAPHDEYADFPPPERTVGRWRSELRTLAELHGEVAS